MLAEFSDADLGEDEDLRINQEFARKFNAEKENAQLAKREVQDAIREMKKHELLNREDEDDDDEEEEEEEEEEDDTGLLVTEQFEEKFMDTLLKIKRKDPEIYDPKKNFFEGLEEDAAVVNNSKASKKEKLSVVNAVISKAMEDESSDSDSDSKMKSEGGYFAEQERLKQSFKTEEEIDDDDLFAVKPGQENNLEISEARMKNHRNIDEFFVNDKEDEASRFLRDYISKSWWKADSSQVPKALEEERSKLMENPDRSEDESYLDQQDKFEHAYNFRFEEPNSSKVVTYPRNVEESIREEPSKRKKQRENKKERKEKELKQQTEELRRLMKLKEKQIKENLDKIKITAGSSSIDESALNSLDLEGDFDPDQFDEQMKKVFGEEFYNEQDVDEETICAQPYGNLEDDESEGETEEGDDEENLDFEEGDDSQRVEKRLTPEEKKEALRKLIESKKELEEVYKLDFEDIAADGLKTRFRYISVPAADYGLKVHDILNADRKSLNQKVSLKHLAPYREDTGEQKHWKEIQRDQRKLYKEYKKRKSMHNNNSHSNSEKSTKPRLRARSRKNLKLKESSASASVAAC